MTTQELINETKSITQSNIDFLRKKIRLLSSQQLKWRPNEQSWSILEIFAHLNEYARFYHNVFKSKIDSTKYKEPKPNFISSPLGKSAWKAMKLGSLNNVKRKFKSPKEFNPSSIPQLISGSDHLSFEENQIELLKIIDLSACVNLQRVKIPISISKFIRLRLGDTLIWITYHNERHVQQVINLMKHRAFPVK